LNTILKYSIFQVWDFKNSTILEIGVGYGILTFALKFKGGDIFTTEHPSREFLNSEYLQLLESNKINLTFQDLNNGLPFKDLSFDKIFFCDVIEHLYPEKVIPTLSEIHRCLKFGGELIISTPNLSRLSNIARFITGRQVNPDIETGRYGATFGHIREYSYKEIQILIERANFDILSVKFGLNPFFNLSKSDIIQKFDNILSKLLFPIIPIYADEIYIKSVKRGRAEN